jgi:uncharacterized protein YcbX
MRVRSLHRYPVKSMLGESVEQLRVDTEGAEGDRRLALIDIDTGHLASAKQPRLWRTLLQCNAVSRSGQVSIRLPDGSTLDSDASDADERLSRLVGRRVRLIRQRPEGATLERPDPEKVLDFGLDAEVDGRILVIGRTTPGGSFTDDAPVHVITTATVEHIGVEALRYRPNVVIETQPDTPPYQENDWVGREMTIGTMRVEVVDVTSRCVVPTLEHGTLPRANAALRTPAAENRIRTGTSGTTAVPCAGAYVRVLDGGGVIASGDQVTLLA